MFFPHNNKRGFRYTLSLAIEVHVVNNLLRENYSVGLTCCYQPRARSFQGSGGQPRRDHELLVGQGGTSESNGQEREDSAALGSHQRTQGRHRRPSGKG